MSAEPVHQRLHRLSRTARLSAALGHAPHDARRLIGVSLASRRRPYLGPASRARAVGRRGRAFEGSEGGAPGRGGHAGSSGRWPCRPAPVPFRPLLPLRVRTGPPLLGLSGVGRGVPAPAGRGRTESGPVTAIPWCFVW